MLLTGCCYAEETIQARLNLKVMVKIRRRKGLLMQGIFGEDHEDGKSRD
jgi:hypothetical protein